jgi:hypothetical protein
MGVREMRAGDGVLAAEEIKRAGRHHGVSYRSNYIIPVRKGQVFYSEW